MLFQSEDLVLAHAKQHRQQLLDEAHAHRQARHAPRARPRPSDRLFHAAGALLVRWGTHLQQRGDAVPTTFVETRPA